MPIRLRAAIRTSAATPPRIRSRGCLERNMDVYPAAADSTHSQRHILQIRENTGAFALATRPPVTPAVLCWRAMTSAARSR